jgi:hypothetical protein
MGLQAESSQCPPPRGPPDGVMPENHQGKLQHKPLVRQKAGRDDEGDKRGPPNQQQAGGKQMGHAVGIAEHAIGPCDRIGGGHEQGGDHPDFSAMAHTHGVADDRKHRDRCKIGQRQRQPEPGTDQPCDRRDENPVGHDRGPECAGERMGALMQVIARPQGEDLGALEMKQRRGCHEYPEAPCKKSGRNCPAPGPRDFNPSGPVPCSRGLAHRTGGKPRLAGILGPSAVIPPCKR